MGFFIIVSFLKVKSSEEGTMHKKTNRINRASKEWTTGNGIKDKLRYLIVDFAKKKIPLMGDDHM